MTPSFALTKNMYFSPAIIRVFPLPPCLFLPPYFPSWHLRFDAGSLSDLPTAMYIYSHSGSFTLQFGYFVRINIWRHSGSRTYTLGLSVSDTITAVHRHLTGQARRWCRQLDEFPGTLYFTIFTFYRSSSWTPAILAAMQTTKLRKNRAYNQCNCTRSFEVSLHQKLWHCKKTFEMKK